MSEIRKNNKNNKFRSLVVRAFPNVFNITPANIFLGFLLAFLVGVAIRLLVDISELVKILLLVGLLVGLVIYFFKYTNLKILFGLFVIAGIIIGILRTDFAIQRSVGWISVPYDGVGKIVRFPESKNDYQRVYMEIVGQKIEKPGLSILKQKEVVLLFVPLGVEYEYGKKYKLKCNLKTAKNKYAKFNYIRFLAGKKVYQVCSGAKVGEEVGESLENENNSLTASSAFLAKIKYFLEESKNKAFRVVYQINKLLATRMNRLLPMPESAYLAGLLLGGDNRLPQNVAESFRRTGTTHTVAVSGYNITILASVFLWIGIGIGLWRKQAFWFVVGSIIVFVVMIGAPSSAVRAGIMGVILLYAAQMGRLANSVRVIILTAVVMIFLSPFIMFYDAGFQLSFLATLGIVLIYTPLAEKFKIENDFLGIKSIVLTTIAAQVGVLGVLIYTFDSISVISLLANVIILPALPLIMLGGALAVGTSFVFNILGVIFALPTWAMLHLEILSIEQLAKFSWAMVEFKGISVWWSLGYYLILIVALVGIKIKDGDKVVV